MKNQQAEALKIALKLITKKDRTEAEIKQKLERKGFSKEDIAETVQYLKQKGFLDDTKFIQKAEKIAEDRFLGKMGLQNYLLSKGIDKELIDSIQDIDDLSLALKLIERKKHLLKEVTDNKKKAKITGFLLRRGFSWDTINRCLKTLDKGGS